MRDRGKQVLSRLSTLLKYPLLLEQIHSIEKLGKPEAMVLNLNCKDKLIRLRNHGLSARGTYMGAAVYADELRTSAPLSKRLALQDEITRLIFNKILTISNFSEFCFREVSAVGNRDVSTSQSSRCLGMW